MAEIFERPGMSKDLEEYGRKRMMEGSVKGAIHFGLKTEQTVEQLCEIYGIDEAVVKKMVEENSPQEVWKGRGEENKNQETKWHSLLQKINRIKKGSFAELV